MKILVTGASGLVGHAVAQQLVESGHEVRCFDRKALKGDLRSSVETVFGDILDPFAVLNAARDCDAIAHLAAVPTPFHETQLMPINVLGTHNVFAAAEAHDVRRVVMASTCAIYGVAFHSSREANFLSLPVKEDHPFVNEDLYALSKQCNELTAATYHRRTGMAVTCLRMTHVLDLQAQSSQWLRRRLDAPGPFPSVDLWGYLDVRDAARAFRLALESVATGMHIVQLAHREPLANLSHRVLLERFYPHLLPFLDHYDAEAVGFWDTSRARDLLGFEPHYSWRDVWDRLGPAGPNPGGGPSR